MFTCFSKSESNILSVLDQIWDSSALMFNLATCSATEGRPKHKLNYSFGLYSFHGKDKRARKKEKKKEVKKKKIKKCMVFVVLGTI